jgi:UDP-N-acetylglucosamine 2-epimerase (non-hydrolysing)
MKRPRVMTVVGTRPEIIKLSRVMADLRKHTEHLLVHTGQNYSYQLNEIFFSELEIPKPDVFLKAAGDTAAGTIANVIVKIDALFTREKPDALLILGDTNSGLAAIPAKRRKIPIFHMEAGNRCFDDRVPEEINRRIIDHTSDINLTYTEHARRYLLREGLKPETVLRTGSPMREVIEYYRPKIDASKALEQLKVSPRGYFLVSCHREENVDRPDQLLRILDSLNHLARHYRKPIIFSTHPRTRLRLKRLGQKARPDPRIRFVEPLGFPDYIHLQQNAFCVLSDSGTLTEEAAILGFPGVMIRDQHERPEGMDEAVVVMAGSSRDRILQAVDLVTRHAVADGLPMRSPADYADANVSKKVTRIILSHIDYVNRTVWHQ